MGNRGRQKLMPTPSRGEDSGILSYSDTFPCQLSSHSIADINCVYVIRNEGVIQICAVQVALSEYLRADLGCDSECDLGELWRPVVSPLASATRNLELVATDIS